jgi:hypothetical protein
MVKERQRTITRLNLKLAIKKRREKSKVYGGEMYLRILCGELTELFYIKNLNCKIGGCLIVKTNIVSPNCHYINTVQ